MGPIGIPEMIIIAVVALIFFGPRKLPELGRSIGKSLAEFKRASNDLKNSLDEEVRQEERRTQSATISSTDPANLPSPASPDTVARGGQGS